MPIEIKELHIHVQVDTPSAASAGAEQQSTVAGSAAAGGGMDKDAVVAECVEQVLQILQNKKER